MNIGENMKKIMKEKNISQKNLAIRLNMSETNVSRYINNQREPNAETLANIATALNTTVDYLLGKTDTEYINSDFGKIKVFVARNATNLTQEQKLEIVNVLFKNKGSK